MTRPVLGRLMAEPRKLALCILAGRGLGEFERLGAADFATQVPCDLRYPDGAHRGQVGVEMARQQRLNLFDRAAVEHRRQPLVAPLEKGQEVGTLALTVDGKPYGQYPVLALQDVPVAGFFGRLWDAIVMFFKSL